MQPEGRYQTGSIISTFVSGKLDFSNYDADRVGIAENSNLPTFEQLVNDSKFVPRSYRMESVNVNDCFRLKLLAELLPGDRICVRVRVNYYSSTYSIFIVQIAGWNCCAPS